jgi:uncharacterized membrane protein YfhO
MEIKKTIDGKEFSLELNNMTYGHKKKILKMTTKVQKAAVTNADNFDEVILAFLDEQDKILSDVTGKTSEELDSFPAELIEEALNVLRQISGLGGDEGKKSQRQPESSTPNPPSPSN